MEVPPTSMVPPMGGPRGGYRGRGGGIMPMRGGGRGRIMGRGGGHYMGGRGMGPMGMGGGPPPQGMMPGGRGMRIPRGGPGGYQGRGGGFMMRGGGMPMRGGRPPIYGQFKQHTGSENNKTVSPVPAASGSTPTTSTPATEPSTAVTTVTDGTVAVATEASSPPPSANTNGNSMGGYIPRGGGMRGRGSGGYSRGRGGYNSMPNGMHGGHGMGGGMPGMDHGPMRRGGMSRGRGGGYGQPMSRSPMHQQHSANTQIAPVPTLKRGAPGGPPGPKRGRYDGGPYSQRPMAPKYHQSQHVSHAPPQSSYGAPPSHHQSAQSHHGYPSHDQTQAVDPYAQSYAAPTQGSYNGYGQSSAYATSTAAQPNTAYHATEYDQSQYQGYTSSTYGTQQDTRYSTYGQDYTQQYGAPAVDYSAAQTDYTQQTQAYDERAYAGYDTQSYPQSYSNAAGYY